jgi:hypothetical protein
LWRGGSQANGVLRPHTRGIWRKPPKAKCRARQVDQWNEDAIKTQAARLAAGALSVWPAPELSPEILAAYRPQAGAGTTYSIQDHPHPLTANMRPLFEAFRKEVLALDACV